MEGMGRLDAATLRDSAGRWATRLEPTVVGRLWSRLLEIEFVDRAVALAAKLLVCVFPLLVLVVAVSPAATRDAVVTTVASRFGLSGTELDLVREAFASPAETRTATGVIGALVTLAYAVSFTTALQRTYLRAWRRPAGGGLGNKRRGAVWVGGVVALVLVLALVRSLLRGPAGTVASWAVGTALSVCLWWWTAHLMLRGEVRWRPLLPTGIVTGVGAWAYTLVATVWFPTVVSNNYDQFGAFGLTLGFVTWFTGFAFVVVVAAVLSPALADGDDSLARWLAPTGECLTPGSAQPLPGPVRPLRLSDAFGRGAAGSGPGRA
jgi:membrane protein